MPSLTWYLRRLRAMSVGELAWRARAGARDALDRCRFALKFYPSETAVGSAKWIPGFRVSDLQPGEWRSAKPGNREYAWQERLRDEADRLLQHRLTFFHLQDHHLGDPVNWNYDHESGTASPLRFAPSIDYRDRRVSGDAKLVWEPNRHHHLVVLGRAYRATAEQRYAAAVVEQLTSWLEQCPFSVGMNWRSPLELAIRLINWVWAVDLIEESGLFTGAFRSKVLHSAYLHLWDITRKYSRGSSANNHRIGEAAGVFIGTSYFRTLTHAARWHEESRRILSEEIEAQTYADGCSREHAVGYQLFVLQFFILAGITARRVGEDLPPFFWSRLEKMLEFVGALSEGGDRLPMFGDSDDGYVLDLGDSNPVDVSALLSVGAVLFGRADLNARAGRYAESARWLLGRSSWAQFEALPAPAEGLLESRAFQDSGYYLLQCGHENGPDRISVLFDCGELGFQSIAAHGHADALSFSLRAFGADIFIDPGTYDYFSFPAWRDYFRSTRAHNTVTVDGVDQSEMLAPFMWGFKANVRCRAWVARAQGGSVTGEHDGFTRLADPVVHRRTVELDGESRILTIRDDLTVSGRHEIAVWFHLSEHCSVSEVETNRFQIAAGGGTVTLDIDPRLSVQKLVGSVAPISGWVSRGYHRKVPGTTLVARSWSDCDLSLLCRVRMGLP